MSGSSSTMRTVAEGGAPSSRPRGAALSAGASRGVETAGLASSITCPSAAPKTSSPRPLAAARRRQLSTIRSTASSVRSGSWWNSASRFTPPARAQSTASSAGL